jgi:site-specific DNA-adenine methylase
MKRPRGLSRWAGGKEHLVARVVPMIEAHLLITQGKLVSLFHGFGAIERAFGGAHIAADKAPELLQMYSDLQSYPALHIYEYILEFSDQIDRLIKPPVAQKAAIRALGLRGFTNPEPVYETARMIYLLAHCFNGVWRVNQDGQFNQGLDPARISLPREDVLPTVNAIELFAAQIERTKFHEGWQTALALAEPGDVVLVDPPYGAFVQYTKEGFTWEAQVELAEQLQLAAARGIGVIAFNAPTPAPSRIEAAYQRALAESRQGGLFGGPRPVLPPTSILDLYRWATVEVTPRKGTVSSNPADRKEVDELLITSNLRNQ